ncbi:hypothetical protein GCM10010393_56420 [Streptomyces gobitricini]|uniref:Uncharacterized protein n=1 Tax=Streptomyces gobitricini TaxID=68211 RepID=A0ABN3N8F5_9ACTN
MCFYGPQLGVRTPPETSPEKYSDTKRLDEFRSPRGHQRSALTRCPPADVRCETRVPPPGYRPEQQNAVMSFISFSGADKDMTLDELGAALKKARDVGALDGRSRPPGRRQRRVWFDRNPGTTGPSAGVAAGRTRRILLIPLPGLHESAMRLTVPQCP